MAKRGASHRTFDVRRRGKGWIHKNDVGDELGIETVVDRRAIKPRDWRGGKQPFEQLGAAVGQFVERERGPGKFGVDREHARPGRRFEHAVADMDRGGVRRHRSAEPTSEEHTSELQSLMRTSYAV